MTPKNPRLRMYYPIVMPVNSQGQGPCPYDEIKILTWEVWDQLCMSYGSHEYLQDAIQQCEDLNDEYHNRGIIREHQPDFRNRMVELDSR